MRLPLLVALIASSAMAGDGPDGFILRADFDGAEPVAGPALRAVTGIETCAVVPGRRGNAVAPVQGRALRIELDTPIPREAATLALWVRPDFSSRDTAQHVHLVVPSADGESHDNWQMQWMSEGHLLFRAGKMGDTDLRIEPMDFSAGQWVHLAMAWDARGTTAYVDGRRAMTLVSPDRSVAPSSTLYIGSWAGGDRWGKAAYDELVIYDRKLTADDIAALAEGSTGAALGPAPSADRRVTRPGPIPAASAEEPDLLVHLNFEALPGSLARWVKPAGGSAKVTSAQGRIGKGALFENGGLCLNAATVFPADCGTAALWVKPNWGGDIEGSKVFFHLDSTQGGTHNYHLQIWGGGLSGRAGALPSDGEPGADTNSEAIGRWRPGQWHHIALTWGRGAIRIYIDGALDAQRSPVTYPNKPVGLLTIGCWQDGSRSADAVLDEFRLYTRDLTPDEIADLASDGK